MERTIAALSGSASARNSRVFPAMIDRTTVAPPTAGASQGMISAAFCGFTATTMAAGSPTMFIGGLSRRPRPASAAISRDGCGSMMATRAGASPRRSHPSSRAPPILPAPTSTRVPATSRSGAVEESCPWLMQPPAAARANLHPWLGDCPLGVHAWRYAGAPAFRRCAAPPRSAPSGFARGLEQGGVDRLAGAGARPYHELEGLVVAFAGVDGGIQQHLALPPRRLDATCQDERVAEHHHAVLAPPVEMAEPQLLVDVADQCQQLGMAPLRHLEVEGAGEMQ